jgi:hypothetical protein
MVLGIAGLTLAFTGPGALSLDALIGYSWSGAWPGVAALFIGLAGGALPLVQRHTTESYS